MKMMDSRLSESLKAFAPIVDTLEGTVMDTNSVLLNAPDPNVSTTGVPVNTTDCSDSEPEKASVLIAVTLDGITAETTPLFLNASSPTVITPGGISARPTQPSLSVTTRSTTVNVPAPTIAPSVVQSYEPPTVDTVSESQVSPLAPKPVAVSFTYAVAPGPAYSKTKSPKVGALPRKVT